MRAETNQNIDFNAGGGAVLTGPNSAPCVRSARVNERNREAAPIWLAALVAGGCQASRNGEDHAVRWNCVAGRALYTNNGFDTEQIEPFGVLLQGGQTVAVSWIPGDTGYTVEVYSPLDQVA